MPIRDMKHWKATHGDIMEVLRRFSGIPAPKAVMGGAIRDGMAGKMVKDIDLFIDLAGTSFGLLGMMMQAQWVCEGRLRWLPLTVTGYGNLRPSILAIGEVVMELGPVNVMIVNTALLEPVQGDLLVPAGLAALLHTNDFGFCQAMIADSLDPDEPPQAYSSEYFKRDLSAHRIILRTCEDEKQLARSMRRLSRFRERYSDWAVGVTYDIVDRLWGGDVEHPEFPTEFQIVTH